MRIVVCGAAGRMGRLLVSLVHETPGARLVGAVEAPGHDTVGRDAGELAGGAHLGVAITTDYGALAVAENVTLDFTVAPAALEHLRIAAEKRAPIVIGTTGFSAAEREEAQTLARRTRTIIAPNMAIGVNVLFSLVGEAARLLGSDFDPEVLEVHHKRKVDAPSGTALALARTVAGALGRDLDRAAVYGRKGMLGPRPEDEIGVAALRGGDIVGDHTVYFLGAGERLELTHRAQSRECLASGAIRAAFWLSRQAKPGLYTMADVLGIPAS